MGTKWEMIPPNDDYKYPQNMPDSLTEIKEKMKKRPFYCYRIFVNNVDHYVPREIAKFFNGEYFLTPQMINSMKDTGKPPPVEEQEDEVGGKGKKGKKGKQSKRQSKAGGSRKSRASGSSRRSSKRQSRSSKASSGKRKSRASKSGGKRKSKASGGRRQSQKSGRRQSQKSGGSRRQSQKSGRRQSQKKSGTKSGKGKMKPAKVPTVAAEPERVEQLVEELWPKFSRKQATFIKSYDWDGDYPYLEDLRLLTKEQIGFDFERAREFHQEPLEWDEELKRKMKERAWMYTRCIPPCGGLSGEPEDDAALFFSEFMAGDIPVPPTVGPGGDTPGAGRPSTQTVTSVKQNVVTLVKEYRNLMWKEDRGEKSLNYYNEDLFWGYPTHQVTATRVLPVPEGELPPYYVFETIPNIKTREDYVRDMFPCMIQIYDITKSPNCIEEAKMALDFLIEELKSYSEDVRLRNQALYGIHTYILLSPLLTWAETRTFAKQPQDVLREEYFRKRIPHPKYKKHWEFENYVFDKALEHRDLLKIIIIGVGCVYGNGDHDLKPYYELARRNITPVLYLGRGYNIVPLIHVEDLVRLILQLTREWPAFTRYIVAAEKQFRNVSEIMEIIAKEIAEGYVSNVPFCFGKGYGIVGEDVHNLLYNEFKFNCTYLHDIKKHQFRHDFGASTRKTFEQYEKEKGYRPTRIVLFGPSDSDQRKIGEALAAHYKVPYINAFRAVKIFLRILLDLQNQVLDAALPKTPKKNWKLGEGKTSDTMQLLKLSERLEWHRENRLLFQREAPLEAMRDAYLEEVKRQDPTNCRVADLQRPDFFEMDTLHKAEPEDAKFKEAKEQLINFDRMKQNGADLLGALIRVDMQALIVHELLKFPTCKNNGYVLDGLPTSEEEAEIIFSRDGVSTTSSAGPPRSKSSTSSPAYAQPQATTTARGIEDYEYLPSHVFHIKKSEREAFRDLIKGEKASSFQKDFMAHFRRMQTHRLIMTKIRSALDFFEDKFNLTTYCFDSGSTPPDQIVKNIIEMIGEGIDLDPLYHPVSEPAIETTVTQDPSLIKQQLGVYSEDDGPRFDAAERVEQLVEPWEIRFPRVEKSLSEIQPEVPLCDRVFTQDEIDEAKKMGEKMIKDILNLPDRALGFINYINKFVTKSVVKAAIKAGEERPEDVIDWTAFHLMANNEGARMPVNKIIPQPPQPNLSEYPFYVDKFDKKYVAHLE
ncbi:hypothetical protein GE061_016393 [Apolygus lucorum]|uniref:Uncharacterized protein n=1 Tax=Apolygus lucorum TaxID=248454 RepID=A0A6A4K7R7_APOLU|nr:hypothetical protein GE061_016393 [Apolygus lucorum]